MCSDTTLTLSVYCVTCKDKNIKLNAACYWTLGDAEYTYGSVILVEIDDKFGSSVSYEFNTEGGTNVYYHCVNAEMPKKVRHGLSKQCRAMLCTVNSQAKGNPNETVIWIGW
jgi:hypothetical protein